MCNHANYNRIILRNQLFPSEVDSVRAGAGPESEVVLVAGFIPRLTDQAPPLGPVTPAVITNHLGHRPTDSLWDFLTTQTDPRLSLQLPSSPWSLGCRPAG